MEPGSRLENYVLIEQIGQGGQAIVWSADDERLKRIVAIKTINPKPNTGSTEGVSSPVDIARRFEDEARIIADLEHPGILPIYTFGQEGESLYIVMRYMAGGSLRRLLQAGPLDLAKTVKLTQPLADALDLAHQRKIIHRDIKSANVLLDARNNLYLADFGLSVTVGETNQPGAGTLAYMSPEQMMGDDLDHRSDLYAFGILLYEMLTGEVPAINGQPWNLQQVMSQTPMPIPDSMSPRVADVLRKATTFKADERYASAAEMVEALNKTIETTEENAGLVYDLDISMPPTDPAMLALIKANTLFDGALWDWADGAGRFRLYADDFKYVDSYYSDAKAWNIELDDAAKRMMLRAALEHGYNVENWWNQLADPVEQRAIALQTLTSELAPARMRAIERLATTGDSDPPAIPTRVAAIMGREPNADVRLAGVRLLEEQATPFANWRPVAFNETIDSTLAEIAATDPSPIVAESAARTCSRLRSEHALTQIGQQAAAGNPKAMRALMFARDEAPNLPQSVPASARREAFRALSVRQFLAPGLIGRYLGAALGFIVGWGIIQYLQYNGRDLLPLQAAGNAAASGVLYSLVFALAILFASELAARLRAWNRPGRIVLAWAVGAILTTIAFVVLRRFYYFNPDPIPMLWFIGPSIVFAGGFAIASGLTRWTWLRSIGGAAGILLAVYFTWNLYSAAANAGDIAEPVIWFGQDELALMLSALLAVSMGALTFLPEFLGGIRRLAGQAGR